jgi:flavin-dependent dehydrogenase
VVNERIHASFLVGAGGHFCPVARELKGSPNGAGTVLAQEMEVRLTPEQAGRCRVQADRPELDFTRDLDGYGWCFRKGDFLNVGLGRLDARALGRDVREYVDWLSRSGRIPFGLPTPLRGHAYRLRQGAAPTIAGPSVLLVGDAAGLAHAASGEGILPAVQSGHVAAEVLLEALGGQGVRAIATYPERLRRRVGSWSPGVAVPGPLRSLGGRAVLGSSWLARHVVLDRLFLHRSGSRTVA